VPVLFDELAELPDSARGARLAEIEASDSTLARELRALFDAERSAGDFLGLLTPAAATQTPLDSRNPTVGSPIASGVRIGPYRIVRPLGRGGMATVWLAHDERLDRSVALKILARDANGGSVHAHDARSQMLAEARLAARLDHPHIANIYDVGETADGEPYIAMAYCDGGSLADRIAGLRSLPLAAIIDVARQLAAALSAAHASGIVHRDVKPANVLFDANGAVRLADFGIAKLTSRDAANTGTVRGTAAYLAPEQLRGEPADHRSDLWAFGVTLYEMIAGRRPFDGASSAAVLYGILASQPEPLERFRAADADDPREPGALAALNALVLRLLAKDPAARPRSAADVERTLIGVRDGALEASPAVPIAASALPTPLTPLIGREHELELAASLLEHVRLLTLTGPGGAGKTRLATELARLMGGHFANGVHVVALASTAGPELVGSAVAQALGLRESPGARPVEQVARHFAGAHALLVLDNFEHVLEAAPIVLSFLTAAPRLTVLVTSRAPLRIQGEQELAVPPLDLPALGARSALTVGGAESVRLFVQRARAGRPDFDLTDDNAADVAAICRRLDGLPLAIELAATRIKLFAPRALRARLEQRLDLLRSDAVDLPARHRTLRDVVDWSYELLAPAEQALLRKLSVFAGGFTLDAAASIAAAHGGAPTTGDSVEVLDRVASLVDRSLLAQRSGEQPDGEPRFQMLETIREYTFARLRDAGEEAAARAAHRAYYLALAEQAAPHLRGPSQVAWLTRLEREHDNLRAAFDDAFAADDVVTAARLAVALQWFWLGSRSFLGPTIERLQALDDRISAAEAVPASGETLHALRARLLTAIGLLTAVRGDHYGVPHRYHEASIAAYRRAGDAAGAATALNHLGWTSFLLGDLESAAAFSQDALARHRAANNLLGVATASINLGWVALTRNELDDAERLFCDALAIHRARRDRRASAYALGHVASTAVARGEYARALALYDEVDALAKPLGDRVLQPTFRVRREIARYKNGAPGEDVLRVLEHDLLPQLREAGHAWSIGFVLAWIGRIRADIGDRTSALEALAESLDVRRSVGDRLGTEESERWLALARDAG
jgi:predicted ATPase/serine/threonine protein kinase